METGETDAGSSAATDAAVSCGDPALHEPLRIACDFLGEADPDTCDRMTVKFQAIAFGTSGPDGVARCRETIEDRFGGARQATAGQVVTDESRVDVTVTRVFEGALEAQRVTLTMRGDRWLIDDAVPADPVLTEEAAAVAEEVERLVLAWYRELDPAVCDSMTDEMLRFGWDGAGPVAREACRSGIRDATPLADVEVRTRLVERRIAFVDVLYGEGDGRQYDQIRLLEVGGEWLIDGVAESGFAE